MWTSAWDSHHWLAITKYNAKQRFASWKRYTHKLELNKTCACTGVHSQYCRAPACLWVEVDAHISAPKPPNDHSYEHTRPSAAAHLQTNTHRWRGRDFFQLESCLWTEKRHLDTCGCTPARGPTTDPTQTALSAPRWEYWRNIWRQDCTGFPRTEPETTTDSLHCRSPSDRADPPCTQAA